MLNIIVTGATSFIGTPLVNKLLNENYFVYAVVRPNSSKLSKLNSAPNLKIVECDLKDISKLSTLIDINDCYAFYHIAWNGTRVPERDNSEIQNLNYINCMEAYSVAKQLKCKYFISTGSQAEYGKCNGTIAENYPTIPTTEYGKAKLKCYQDLKINGIKDGIKIGWLRIFSAYGPGDYDQTLIMYAINQMMNNADIEMTSGIQNWNYIFIDDVINILVLLMKVNNYTAESFNVCSDDNRMLKDYIVELKQILNSKSKLNFGTKKYNNSEGMISFIPKNDNIKKYLNYDKFTSFKDGIASIIRSKK